MSATRRRNSWSWKRGIFRSTKYFFNVATQYSCINSKTFFQFICTGQFKNLLWPSCQWLSGLQVMLSRALPGTNCANQLALFYLYLSSSSPPYISPLISLTLPPFRWYAILSENEGLTLLYILQQVCFICYVFCLRLHLSKTAMDVYPLQCNLNIFFRPKNENLMVFLRILGLRIFKYLKWTFRSFRMF